MKNDKLQLYYKLYDLSRRQKEEILHGSIDNVLQIIQEKSEILSKLEDVDLAAEIRSHHDPQGTLIEMQTLLEGLTELEEENAELLREMAPDLNQKVQNLNQKYLKASKVYQENKENKDDRGGSKIDQRS
ncbi:MAG: hypothetical protein ACQEQG_08085 [Bacillota bacterium]